MTCSQVIAEVSSKGKSTSASCVPSTFLPPSPFLFLFPFRSLATATSSNVNSRDLTFQQLANPIELDDGWPESEKGKDVDVKYIEERRRCEKISEERMNI